MNYGKPTNRSAHTGTYKGYPSISTKSSTNRTHTYWGGAGGALGKGHGHRVTSSTSRSLPLYHRNPGQSRSTAWDLGKIFFGPAPKKRR